jgi:molybdenum-dependent DNA-binding transcriptional regulator ModE
MRNAELNIEDLRTFVEVADTGGVSPAARRLGVSKSIVSRQLARLEAELGVQLLARNSRGASLTEAEARSGITRPVPAPKSTQLGKLSGLKGTYVAECG